MVKELQDTRYYKIKKACLEHTCDTYTNKGYVKRATNQVLAAVYKRNFKDPQLCLTPMDLQQLVLEDLCIGTNNLNCWRVSQVAVIGVRGLEPEQYRKLSKYLRLLKDTNLGTIADLETKIDHVGNERFVYSFLAFGTSIQRFRKLCPLLVLDGIHLSGMNKGVLLTTSGQDANFQVYPLAFVVVDSENDDSWTWFLMKLERIIADNPSLTIISDRCPSIYNAKANIFWKAHHGCCMVHLQRNVNLKFKSKGLIKLVGEAAMAYRVGKYKQLYMQICNASGECKTFSMRLEMLTGLEFISKENDGSMHGKEIPPEIDKQLTKIMKKGKGIKYGRTRLPYSHALLAADATKASYHSTVYHDHKGKTWQSQYIDSVFPKDDPSNYKTNAEVEAMMLHPPTTKTPPGRPKKNMFPSVGEIPMSDACY